MLSRVALFAAGAAFGVIASKLALTISQLRTTTTTTSKAEAEGKDKSNKNVYETQELVDMYLLMHFGTEELLLSQGLLSAANAIDFPRRCAQECERAFRQYQQVIPTSAAAGAGAAGAGAALHKLRAIDVGCAVGRAAFELTAFFDEVVALDFSHAFIETANRLKKEGRMSYRAKEEGDIYVQATAVVDQKLDRSKVTFLQGDACHLPESLGQYHVVLAANLLCRLPKPRLFLARLSSLVLPGGLLVLPSPYTWLEEYTPKSEWIGGVVKDGVGVKTIEGLKKELGQDFELVEEASLPFFIRETARKNQWTVSHETIWRRKRN